METSALRRFLWDDLGNIKEGRAHLGMEMPVFLYRLLQYTLKDVLTEEFGADAAHRLYKKAGYLAGREFAKAELDLSGEFDIFIANLTNRLKELKIGILYVEKADLENWTVTLTISEDLDCSGLPVTGEHVCHYDEGFLAGILETYSQIPFEVQEVDCWASGDRTCRFIAVGKP